MDTDEGNKQWRRIFEQLKGLKYLFSGLQLHKIAVAVVSAAWKLCFSPCLVSLVLQIRLREDQLVILWEGCSLHVSENFAWFAFQFLVMLLFSAF